MTSRRGLLRHLRQLSEIRDIMNAMKNLALMETRKLARYLDTQYRIVSGIEAVAADFLGFHPGILAPKDDAKNAYLLIGSERGFCGDFNGTLLAQLDAELTAAAVAAPLLIAVGHRLCARLEEDARVATSLDGPNMADEVPAVLNQLIAALSSLQARHDSLSLIALYHDAAQNQVDRKQLLPPFQPFAQAPARLSHPPLLNLPPERFLAELIDHYLFAALHEIFYTSLMAENHRRVEHMEGAVAHLDDQAADLTRKYHILRQEEITEEIEVMLLSTESPASWPRRTLDKR